MGVAVILPEDNLVLVTRKGIYSVSGTVQVSSAGVVRLVLCLTIDGALLGATFSETDGSFSFQGLAYNNPVLIVVPGLGTENPRVHRVTPG